MAQLDSWESWSFGAAASAASSDSVGARRLGSAFAEGDVAMRIACLLANGFEDSEFKQPYDALKAAGHDVTIVGMEAGQRLNGDKGRETATVEKAFADVHPDDFDAAFIPGG